jgi:hypothetical protein
MSDQTLPETIRYEHYRLVVLTAEAHAPHAPVLMFTEPMPMRSHEWRKAREEGFGVEVLPTGGWTNCIILNAEGRIVATGHTRCSYDDIYAKATGRIKSLGKALSVLKAAS